MPWSGIASAIGSVAGGALGLLGNSASNAMSASLTREMWQKNYDAQKEFAQNGIRWKVSDAQAAGLHPLAALGASTSFSPTASVGNINGSDFSFLERAGAGIGRAIQSKMTTQERIVQQEKQDLFDAARLRGIELQNQNIELQNKLLDQDFVLKSARASQQAISQSGLPPAMPTISRSVQPGNKVSGTSEATSPGHALPPEVWHESKTVPDVTWSRTADGGYFPVRSQDMADRLDDDIIGTIMWHLRNHLSPTFTDSIHPPDSLLPPGYHWERQNLTYYPVKNLSRHIFPGNLQQAIDNGYYSW